MFSFLSESIVFVLELFINKNVIFDIHMVKCDVCGQKIQTTFLGKLVGTVVKDSNGKQKNVCRNCQSKHGSSLKEIVE
jgi:hypothetical protein